MFSIGDRVQDIYEEKRGNIIDIKSFNGSELYIVKMSRAGEVKLFKDELKRAKAIHYHQKRKRK